jgi:hypothetical protein
LIRENTCVDRYNAKYYSSTQIDMWIIKKLKNIFGAMPFWAKAFLFISIILIIVVQFLAKRYNYKYYPLEEIMEITLNLSYSYLAGYILYYIAVYIPLERKKVAAFRLLNNKLLSIKEISRNIIYSLYEASSCKSKYKFEDLDYKSFKSICADIKPNNSCKIRSYLSRSEDFQTWSGGIIFNFDKIKNHVNVMMNFSDCLSPEILMHIHAIIDEVDRMVGFLSIENHSPAQRLDYISSGLMDINKTANYIFEIFKKEFTYAEDKYHKTMREFYKINLKI